MSERGRFIVLEGADGAGTTTQAKALAAWLEGEGGRAHVTQEPSGGPIGRLIRELLRGGAPSEARWQSLALLFAADRLDHYEREIAPKLDDGAHVISDRYLLSSLVYQGLHVPLDWVETLNRHAPVPDVTVVLDVDADEAWARQLKRGGAREVYDERELQREVCRRYRELAPRVSAAIVDGAGSIDEVTERLRRVVAPVLSRA